MKSIQIFKHVTDGGATYLTDNHSFADADIIIRIDGGAELVKCNTETRAFDEEPIDFEIRNCSACNKVMSEGYVFAGGEKYFCSDKCLHTEVTKEEWEELSEGEDNDMYYWTVWDIFNEQEDQQEEENPKFKVVVNSLLRRAILTTTINECEYVRDIYFKDLDEWTSQNIGGKIFDIHFLYATFNNGEDAEFSVSIYPFDEHKDEGVQYQNPCEVDLEVITGLEKKEEVEIYVLFGTDAVRAYERGENLTAEMVHNIQKDTFQTEMEKRAYINGMEDNAGWDAFLEISKEDYIKVTTTEITKP